LEEHLGSEPVLFALAPAFDVGEVLARHITFPVYDVALTHPFFGDNGGVLIGISLLAPDFAVDLKAPTEVHEELVVGVGDERGVVALIFEDLRKRSLLFRDRRPMRLKRECSYPRVNRPPGRDGWHGVRVGAAEAQRLLGQDVKGWCLHLEVSVGSHVVPSQAVEDDQDYVQGRTFRRIVRWGRFVRGVGERSVRAQLAAKAGELSRDAPATLRKSLRVGFRLPTCVPRSYAPLRQGSMTAYDLACRVVRRGTFLLIAFLLTGAGGVVSLPMRHSAVVPHLFLFIPLRPDSDDAPDSDLGVVCGFHVLNANPQITSPGIIHPGA
jgi:hypothetical protein